MAARLAVGIDAHERLRRLAIVFAVELRLMIVAELYMREMSARLFFDKFGGGTLSRVSQNFTLLATTDWLRHVYSKGPGGDRHGGVEHFYRATEPPYFDAESWALIPYSVRCTASLNLFRQIAPRLAQDLEPSKDRDEYRRELSCAQVLLDAAGWQRVIGAVSAQFARLYEEQEDSRRRALHSGEQLIRADVLLTAFQSPDSDRQTAADDLLVVCRREPLVPFPERLAPILADEVRRGIVWDLNQQETSVTQFHREIGGASKSGISRRFRGLEDGGWVTKGRTRTGGSRRSAREQFYNATKPAIQDYDPFAGTAISLRKSERWQTFEHLCELAKQAMLAGTFDRQANRFLSWSMVSLDREGRENVTAGVDSLSDLISQEQEQAKQRMSKSGERPITMTVGLAALEGLKNPIKAP